MAERTAAPTWMVAVLFVLNTAGVVAFQMRVARGVTDLASAARAARWAGVVLLAACAVFGLSTSLFGLGTPAARMVGPLALTALVLSGSGWGWLGRARSGVPSGGGQSG